MPGADEVRKKGSKEMNERMGKKIVIWPAYLAAGKTKREGRIVSIRYTVKAPKVEEIEKVARALNLEPEVEKEKAYPRTHWEKSGRVLVAKRGRKGAIVKEIAKGIKEMREKAMGMRR
jgi:signal recognition particle subunit SRP19